MADAVETNMGNADAAAGANEQAAAGAEAAAQGQGRAADGKFAGKGVEQAAAGSGEPDWRAEFAGSDDKALKRLERFASKSDFYKSFAEKDALISKGGHLPKPPADDAPDEVKAEWRKTLGVPDKPDGYAVPKIAGLEFGEGDEPLLNSFREALHKKGAPQGAFDAGVEWYASVIAEATAAQREADDKAKLAFEEKLGEEWGADYRTNLVMAERHLDGLPDGVGDKLKAAFGNDPDVMRWAAFQARMNGYLPRGIQKGAGDPKVAIGERMAQLEAMMGDPTSDYWKKDGTGARLQTEFLELADNREKMNRNAA